jgi:arylsulfatase A-like enzyme
MVKWPGKTEAGSTSKQITSLTDFFATVKEIACAEDEHRPRDSYSLLPLLLGEQNEIDREPVIHHSGGGKFGIRDGDWKLIEGLGSGGFSEPRFPKPGPGDPEGQLYNIADDISEQENLYDSEPEKVEELKRKLKEIRGY